VESDGVTLSLDPNRSDLFVVAELARFSDELPHGRANTGASGFRRRFRVTPESIERWQAEGLGLPELSRWFSRRTGSDLPAAIRLLADAPELKPGALRLERAVVLRVASAEWLDGLGQHPDTSGLIGERLGPTTCLVPEASIPLLIRTLAALGIAVEVP
jgi:hypothetical protein